MIGGEVGVGRSYSGWWKGLQWVVGGARMCCVGGTQVMTELSETGL